MRIHPVVTAVVLVFLALIVTVCVAVPSPGQVQAQFQENRTKIVPDYSLWWKSPTRPVENPVFIETSPDRFTPLMSSTIGISMKPIFPDQEMTLKVWETRFGHFASWDKNSGEIVSYGRRVRTPGDSVYWTYDADAMGVKKPPVLIRVTLMSLANGTPLASGKVLIHWEDTDMAVVTPPDRDAGNISPKKIFS